MESNEENKKNVHAFAIDTLRAVKGEVPAAARIISYNHKKGNTFYDKETGEPVKSLDKCYRAEKVLIA